MTRDESAHFHALALDLEATASAMKAMAPASLTADRPGMHAGGGRTKPLGD
jgi:hypothetical protein